MSKLLTPLKTGEDGTIAMQSSRPRSGRRVSHFAAQIQQQSAAADVPLFRFRRTRRAISRGIALFFRDVLTRSVVEGTENIPREGPVLVLPNHLSNLDGGLILANFPRQIEMVGPGDFKMVTIKDMLIKLYGMALVKRGLADRAGMKIIFSFLKAGHAVLMFPGGGMWEKRMSQVKHGAAYISQAAQTPMLPVALGGAYLKTMDAVYLRRPKTYVRFGELLPPVPPSKSRQSRDSDLAAASRDLMMCIYDMLPRADQMRYDRWEREEYAMQIDFAHERDAQPVFYDGPSLPNMAALAEFIIKPNLFRPMWQNTGLYVDPFRLELRPGPRFFPAIEVKLAAGLLLDLIGPGGAFEPYLPYRMGEHAGIEVAEALRGIRRLCDWAVERRARIRLTPLAHDPGPVDARSARLALHG